MSRNLVVKSSKLNSVIQNLSLSEIRLVQLGVINARETGEGLATDKPLRVDAMQYANVFNVTKQTAYEMMKQAEVKLFNRQFSYIDTDNRKVKSHWVQRVKYLDDEGAIELVFTVDVVDGISRLDGKEQFFTSYLLEQTSSMKSNYSVRLYELLTQWKTAKKTPVFKLEEFRGQLGLGVSEYKAMCNFKARVLDKAVKEINEKSDIKVKYEQVKKGRTITGFKFSVIEQTQKQNKKKKNDNRDGDTVDWLLGLTDKQLERITRSQKFIDDYNSLVSPTSSANQSMSEWTEEFLKRLKATPKKFNKRPLEEYLDDIQAKGW